MVEEQKGRKPLFIPETGIQKRIWAHPEEDKRNKHLHYIKSYICSLHNISIFYINVYILNFMFPFYQREKVRYKFLKSLQDIWHFSMMISAELEVKATSMAD
uniref:Uncharacterized protein n=1 Tax=Micrurus surinamensis TaxID=129470 RepID=A0A2D4PB70_MICSU